MSDLLKQWWVTIFTPSGGSNYNFECKINNGIELSNIISIIHGERLSQATCLWPSAPLLSCHLLLHWVLGVCPPPLCVSFTTLSPCVVRSPPSLHPLPPYCLMLSAPHYCCDLCCPIALHCLPPPSCCNLHRPIASHHPPPTHLALCPCFPTVNCCAYCSNHRRCSLNLIVVFSLDASPLPTIAIARLPPIVSFVPLFLLCCPPLDCLASCPLPPYSCCGIRPPPLVISSAAWSPCIVWHTSMIESGVGYVWGEGGRRGRVPKMLVLNHA